MVHHAGSRLGQKISEKYTLGEEIGRGGFGTVFACRNSETGETVAVKRIGLRNLNKESLRLIEEEVSLLKKLDHPNIVKYIDTVRTHDHLHIVLEYMENGSLARNLKLFGALSQSLCALYIRQVLMGLAYLHDQGVIHRDIKGANILTTKQGLVKLADFGVATHTSAQSNDVVGTPYWMAPEIIEISGPTTACDIWSVGCTIIELLTLKPPYFDIPPMAALYRIVQDEHPPLPEGLSPALRDFLVLCFKKEPRLRSTAKDLLRHRWVQKTRDVQQPDFSDDPDEGGAISSDGAEDPLLAGSDSELDNKEGGRREGRASAAFSSAAAAADDSEEARKKRHSKRLSRTSKRVSSEQRSRWRKSVMNTIRLSEAQRAEGLLQAQKEVERSSKQQASTKADGGSPRHASGKTAHDDDDEDDDDDDEEEEDEDWSKWDGSDLRDAANRSRKQRSKRGLERRRSRRSGSGKAKASQQSKSRQQDKNDDSDNDDSDNDSDELDFGFGDVEDGEAGQKIRDEFRAMMGSRVSGKLASLRGQVQAGDLAMGDVDMDDLDGAFGEDADVKPLTRELEKQGALDKGVVHHTLESRLARFRESGTGEDDFLDFGVGGTSSGTRSFSSRTDTAGSDVIEVLRRRMAAAAAEAAGADGSGKSGRIGGGGGADGVDDEDEAGRDADPFLDEFFEEEDDDERDFIEDAGRSLEAQHSQQVEKLISLLHPEQDDDVVLNACAKLTTLFREQPAQRRTLLTHHGVIPIMDMLEMSNTKVLHAVLKVVGQIIENDREFQELLSLAGLIPIVAKFCRPAVSRPIRLQAASLVRQFLKTSGVTLQMFVACGGLPVLAGLLVPCSIPGETPEAASLRAALGVGQQVPDIALACVAVEGIKRVFDLSTIGGGRGTIPKNDFCRLFAKEGVLRQLVALLEHCRSPKGEAECAQLGFEASSLIMDICETLLVFSHGDSVVKQHFADTAVLEGILRTLTLEAPFFQPGLALGRGSSHSLMGGVGGGSSSGGRRADPREVGRSGKVALGEEEIGPLIKTLLKCVKNLSMEPSVLDALEAAGAIPTLVPFLAYCSSMSKLAREKAASGPTKGGERGARNAGAGNAVEEEDPASPRSRRRRRNNSFLPGRQLSASQEQLVKEVQNLVMLAMFYLCRLSRSRQEQAAISGIIPYLMDAVATRSPVKTFALQILTDFAHTSDLTRDQLWRCEALEFYLDLLVSGDVFWQEKALISLGAWLTHASPEVERAVLRPRSLQCLVTLFQSAQGSAFENYVKELLLMLTRSAKLSEAIGRSGLFMAELVARLSFPKAEVRINLLKMLKIIGEHHQDLEHLVLEHNLFAVVSKLAKQAEDAHRVLVVEIANQLLDEWKAALLPTATF